jgi:Protein of unknown function (DUF3684)
MSDLDVKETIHPHEPERRDISATLTMFSARVQVALSEKMKEGLLQATKKKPPHEIRFNLLYVIQSTIGTRDCQLNIIQTDYDESEAKDSCRGGSIFHGLRADMEGCVPFS